MSFISGGSDTQISSLSRDTVRRANRILQEIYIKRAELWDGGLHDPKRALTDPNAGECRLHPLYTPCVHSVSQRRIRNIKLFCSQTYR